MKEAPRETSDAGIPYVSIKTRFHQLQTFSDIKKTVRSLAGDPADVSVAGLSRSAHGVSSTAHPDVSTGGSPGSCGELDTRKRVLCVWDVDDTLVSSGPSGVRQHPLFTEEELTGLYRNLKARHLLLSQGSIDDVFAPGGLGKLQYLAPFFLPQTAAMSAKKSKVNVGCGGFFTSCGRPNTARQTNSNTAIDKSSSGIKKKKKGEGKDNDEDKDAGADIVRIATLRAPPEQPEDTELFFSEDKKPPRCSSEVRWLVMRPSLWGISLASLSNFIAPSEHTAFLDGSVFHKMDVVRSLAASGLWDVVFFMDNDLTELGLIRPGLGIDDYYRMKSVGKLLRFFQGDYLLLEVSAALEEKERKNNVVEVTTSPSKDTDPILNGNSTEVKNGERKKSTSISQAVFLPLVQILGTENKINGERKVSDCSTSVMKNKEDTQSQGQVVELVLAHLRLSGAKFRRITKVESDPLSRKEREWWHPALRTGPPCTDEHYTQLMEDFFIFEAEVLNEVAKPSPQIMTFYGWEPSIGVVRYPIYKRPEHIPKLNNQYEEVCHQVITNIIEQLDSRLTAAQEYELKREANILYRRLIRRQPVIDPQLIVKLATALFETLRSEGRLPRNLSDRLKKDIRFMLGDVITSTSNSNISEGVNRHNSPTTSSKTD
ncbi:uncharacterized protein TM35_000171320 [Trypanosoma theileri]|uniref:Uncharacterized protein n=1 Tax=Trypanosoma theileri TaxID=67003 RepID=A0A1X0NVW2_9TRYP|nr:uncharacterized protein TM35_000171320 [Trypanosoma theileri]ORC88260.1 hypothetical protein TM35_000171320 [Trypanosoma theileri]